MTRRIGVIGVGSIGSVLARGFGEMGHDVVVCDTDPTREQALPFRSRPAKWIAVNCDFTVIAVPTPTPSVEAGGDADAVDDVLGALGQPNSTIVIRSTMPPGATHRLARKHGLPLVYSPEFLRDRSGVDDFFDPDRIVLAGPDTQVGRVNRLFDHPAFEDVPVIVTQDYLTAEIGKEAHNAFFATKVSFANQVRHICDETGANPRQVMRIVTADHRNTESHLDPMLGPFGGKCLPKDTDALRAFAREYDADAALLDAVVAINDIAADQYDNVQLDDADDADAPIDHPRERVALD